MPRKIQPGMSEGPAGRNASPPGDQSAGGTWKWLLIALGAFAVVAALTLLAWKPQPAQQTKEEGAAHGRQAAAPAIPPGPWGKLTATSILISPPLEYVAADWGRPESADQWYFPGASSQIVDAFLMTAGLSPQQVQRLAPAAKADARIRGTVIRPPAELLRSLSPETRARLYLELGKSGLNFDQANAFRFAGSSPNEWFAASSISAETRRAVEPLIYRDGDFMLFSDAAVVRSEIQDVEELRRLAKTLLRQRTVLVKLTIEGEDQLQSLADYWGRGGRRTDLFPLLDSVYHSVPDRSIDIVHLLPTFARNNLYRYPRLTAADLDKPILANCLWSSLNFFSAHPDARYLDVKTALATLKNDYFIVETNFQLGDVVALLDANGNLFHVANYLAGGLVLSKNGTSPVAPWAITTIEELKGYYHSRSSNPRVLVHRRNDL